MRTRNIFLLYLIFFVGFFIIGCDHEKSSFSINQSDSAFIEMASEGKIYNDDPSASVEDVYSGSDIEKMLDDVAEGDPYAIALLGILYYSNSSRYGIKRDTEKGRQLLKQAWSMGVADVGYALFEVYGKGIGVAKNRALALEYLQASAEIGYLKSQREMAKDYFSRGEFNYLETDYALARKWYTRAAEQGDQISAVALAKIYHEGLGVERDDNRAFEWVSRSENMKYGGPGFSIGALAQFYEEGIGTEINLVQAYKYRDLMGTAGGSYKKELVEKMTPEQIQEAVRLSGEWQREHNIFMPNSEGYQYR